MGASSLDDMPGEDSANRKRGRIERRGDALRVRVFAGEDPVTGKRVYRSETVPGTDRAAQRRAEKALTRLLAEVDKQRAPTSTVTLIYVLDLDALHALTPSRLHGPRCETEERPVRADMIKAKLIHVLEAH